MHQGEFARLRPSPAFGEFRGSGPVVVGPFADIGALLWRLLACDRPGAGPTTGAVIVREPGSQM